VLKDAGLVTDDPAVIYRATDKQTGTVYFVEIFSWKDASSSDIAHRTPEVQAIWEPMEEILEGGPSPQLAVIERVDS
jgi:quinol monooxygenase YgiN